MTSKTRFKSALPDVPVVLAVASAGGHWHQMMQVIAAFEGTRLTIASTDPDLGRTFGFEDVKLVPDCNQDKPFNVLFCIWRTFVLVRTCRPDLIVSTGAAPGLLCLMWGRVTGAKTIWIDSIANSEKLSLSGRIATWFAETVLTQWSHLAEKAPLKFKGAVI